MQACYQHVHLIPGRDGLASAGVEAVMVPPRSPRANASPEPFVLTARTEVTDRRLVFGDRRLRPILAEYEAHYNGRRPPSQPPAPPASRSHAASRVIRRNVR